MRFREALLKGVVSIASESLSDARGSFARIQCADEFSSAGHPFEPAQTSLSRNPTALTLRGMHYRLAPFSETKLVRVVRGRIFDVAVDLRPESPTHRQWFAAELSADNMEALLIPEGVAHGFLTLEPDTDVLYQISPKYAPGHDAGVRWDDPAFGIDWPERPQVISERDAAYPDYQG